MLQSQAPWGCGNHVEAMTKWANTIDTREQQQHLDNAISVAKQ